MGDPATRRRHACQDKREWDRPAEAGRWLVMPIRE